MRSYHLVARRRFWMLPVLLVALGGHGIILYYGSSHLMVPTAAMAGALILMLFRHVRQARSEKPRDS